MSARLTRGPQRPKVDDLPAFLTAKQANERLRLQKIAETKRKRGVK